MKNTSVRITLLLTTLSIVLVLCRHSFKGLVQSYYTIRQLHVHIDSGSGKRTSFSIRCGTFFVKERHLSLGSFQFLISLCYFDLTVSQCSYPAYECISLYCMVNGNSLCIHSPYVQSLFLHWVYIYSKNKHINWLKLSTHTQKQTNNKQDKTTKTKTTMKKKKRKRNESMRALIDSVKFLKVSVYQFGIRIICIFTAQEFAKTNLILQFQRG